MSIARVFALFLVVGSSTGCERFDLAVSAYGLDAEQMEVEKKMLGRLDAAALKARVSAGDIDGHSAVPDDTCAGTCRVLEITVYIKNVTDRAFPPPVIRMQAPVGREARLPVALRAKEISPGRTGRIRWLVSLYDDEATLTVDISGSVMIDIKPGLAPSSSTAP